MDLWNYWYGTGVGIAIFGFILIMLDQKHNRETAKALAEAPKNTMADEDAAAPGPAGRPDGPPKWLLDLAPDLAALDEHGQEAVKALVKGLTKS